MYNLQTSTLGVMDTPEQQHEYSLIVSTIACAWRGRGDWIAKVTSWFKPEYISDPYFRRIYQTVLAMQEDGTPITDAELAARLPLDGTIFQKRAAEFYGFFVDGGEAAGHEAGNIIYYAKQVHNAHRRVAAGEELAGAASDMNRTSDPDAVLDRLPEIANKYAPSPENLTRDNKSVMQEILDELDGKRESGYFTFGISGLDNAIGGVAPGALVTVAGETGHGKSVFMGQSAMRCITKHTKAVLYFTMEMGTGEMYKRWAAHLSRQPIKGGDRRQFIQGLSRIERMQADGLLHVFPGAATIEEIRNQAVAYAKRCELGMVVVDYLQIIESTSNDNYREREIAKATMSLKNLASRLRVPVLTGSQLNDQGQVRESRAIKQTSNILLKIAADKSHEPIVECDIEIEKSRDSGRDIAHAIWEKPLYTIRDKHACDLSNYDPALAGERS